MQQQPRSGRFSPLFNDSLVIYGYLLVSLLARAHTLTQSHNLVDDYSEQCHFFYLLLKTHHSKNERLSDITAGGGMETKETVQIDDGLAN